MFLFTSNQVKSLHLKNEFTHLPKCVGFENLTFKTFSNLSCITLHNFYPSFDVHLNIVCVCFLVHWSSDYLLGYYLLLYISQFSNTDKSSINSIFFSYCTSSPGVKPFIVSESVNSVWEQTTLCLPWTDQSYIKETIVLPGGSEYLYILTAINTFLQQSLVPFMKHTSITKHLHRKYNHL